MKRPSIPARRPSAGARPGRCGFACGGHAPADFSPTTETQRHREDKSDGFSLCLCVSVVQFFFSSCPCRVEWRCWPILPIANRRGVAMRSPFPGMDPYIEASHLWEDFDSHLIDEIYRALSDVLPDR